MKKYLKLLAGFPVGVAVLMLTYLLIGAVDGESNFMREISKLSEYRYLLAQVVFSGLDYVIVACAISVFNGTFDNTTDGSYLTWKTLGKFLLTIWAMVPVFFILSKIIDRKGTMNGYVGNIFYELTILGMIAVSLSVGIYRSIECKKINKALKQKQAQ